MNESSKSIVLLVGNLVRFRLFQSGIFKKISSLNMLITFLVLLFSCSDQPFEEELEDDYSSRLSLEVTKFVLVNAITNEDIGELLNNSTINSSVVNIRVEAQAESVVFQLSGTETHTQTENVKPFAMKGDINGKYNAWTPKLGGSYTLKVTPYSSSSGKGTAGTTITINFKVKSEPVVTPIVLLSTVGEPPLYFQGNFDNATVDRSKITGWDTEMNKVGQFRVQQFSFNASVDRAYATPKQDPVSGRRVLEIAMIDDDPTISGTARVSWGIGLEKPMEIIHYKYKMKLSNDFAELNNYPGEIRWLIITEFWNAASPDLGATQDGSARWNLQLLKDKTGSLYWMWDTEYMQPAAKRFQDMYARQFNRTEPIPYGKWIELELYFHKNGRTRITIDGRPLFDFTGVNSYPGHPELYVANNKRTFQPFKIYTDDVILDWVRSRGKKLSIMYNDFKWYKE
jgi:hypothetical protein